MTTFAQAVSAAETTLRATLNEKVPGLKAIHFTGPGALPSEYPIVILSRDTRARLKDLETTDPSDEYWRVTYKVVVLTSAEVHPDDVDTKNDTIDAVEAALSSLRDVAQSGGLLDASYVFDVDVDNVQYGGYALQDALNQVLAVLTGGGMDLQLKLNYNRNA